MKKTILILALILGSLTSNATIHVIRVWDGYFQFLGPNTTIYLGDTVQWLPLDMPSMVHTITSTNIPAGAATFDQIWQAPADTFFQYIPQVVGLYEYECTPHVLNGMVGSFEVFAFPLGLENATSLKNEIVICPNPASDYFEVRGADANALFNIYGLKGELIKSGSLIEPIDVTSFSNGVYMLEIIGHKPRKLRLLKQ